MILRQLKIFSEVCRFESITQAAEELNMAQPAVSLAIRELESYYGVRLFERMNRRLYISEAGKQLYSYATSILEQCEEAKNVLRDTQMLTKIRIGTNISFGIGNLPEILSDFSKKYTQIPIYSMVKNSSQIEEQLLQNNLDFGIIDFPENHTLFHYRKIGATIIRAACSKEFAQTYFHTQKNEAALIPIHLLEKVPLLLREKGSGLRLQIDNLLKQAGIEPKLIMESDSIHCILKTALNGMGLLFLPEPILTPYFMSKKLQEIHFSNVEIKRDYYLVYHKSKFLTKSMKAFLEYMSNESSNVN